MAMREFRKRSSNFCVVKGRGFSSDLHAEFGGDLHGRNWRKICKQTLERAFAEDLQGSLSTVSGRLRQCKGLGKIWHAGLWGGSTAETCREECRK